MLVAGSGMHRRCVDGGLWLGLRLLLTRLLVNAMMAGSSEKRIAGLQRDECGNDGPQGAGQGEGFRAVRLGGSKARRARYVDKTIVGSTAHTGALPARARR